MRRLKPEQRWLAPGPAELGQTSPHSTVMGSKNRCAWGCSHWGGMEPCTPLHPPAHKTEGRAPPPQDPAGWGLHLPRVALRPESWVLTRLSSPQLVGACTPAAASHGFGRVGCALRPLPSLFWEAATACLLARHLVLEAGESQQLLGPGVKASPSRGPHPPSLGLLAAFAWSRPVRLCSAHDPHPPGGACCGAQDCPGD